MTKRQILRRASGVLGIFDVAGLAVIGVATWDFGFWVLQDVVWPLALTALCIYWMGFVLVPLEAGETEGY